MYMILSLLPSLKQLAVFFTHNNSNEVSIAQRVKHTYKQAI